MNELIVIDEAKNLSRSYEFVVIGVGTFIYPTEMQAEIEQFRYRRLNFYCTPIKLVETWEPVDA